MNRRKPILGEKLILRRWYRHPTRFDDTEITVSKVGRKYWEATREGGFSRPVTVGPFLVESWDWAGYNQNHNEPIFIAENQQQLDDHEEHGKLVSFVRETLRTTRWEDFSLERLRAIKEAIEDQNIN